MAAKSVRAALPDDPVVNTVQDPKAATPGPDATLSQIPPPADGNTAEYGPGQYADPMGTKSELGPPAVSGQRMKPAGAAPATGLPTAPGYRMLGVLGRGGMGVVYKAIQQKANRPVALKMILGGAHADQAAKLRFRVEAEAAARLSHPHIVQVYEVGETPEGFPFFSLEFVAGGNLAERLKQGPLRSGEAAVLVEALARAMQYAHEHGIVHRDLKPLNILLEGTRSQESGARSQGSGNDKKETIIKNPADKTLNRPELPASRSAASLPIDAKPLIPKISDFGLAKQLDAEDALTRTGAIMGSPSYMAPEQAFGQSKNVGPAADIYALGAILYECLTGRPPFKGASVADTLEQVRTMEPITIRTFAKEIPADLETICLHCLHKDPLRRYASAEALADDLRRFQEQKPISVRPVSNFERAWRWCRRNPGWAGMIAAMNLLVITIIGGLSYGIVTMAALNDAIVKERDQKDQERKKAENEEKKAKLAQKKAEDEEAKAKEQTALAKARLDDSIQAVGLFATDAKVFCDDALVPGDSRTKLYKVLVDQLEKQAAAQDAGPPSADALRNRAWMYQNIAGVYGSLGNSGKAEGYYLKGIKAADQWLKVEPENAHAQSHRAALLFSLATLWDSMGRRKEAQTRFTEALEVRRKLLDNPEVDQFTPGKSITNLADSLEAMKQFEESLALRERAHALYVERGLPTFVPLDNWAGTCLKVADLTADYAKKKALLTKADELCEKAIAQRPTSRMTLLRWAKVAKDLGELEYNHGKLAEKANKIDEARAHFDEAHKHFRTLATHSKTLATSFDLVEQMRNYSRSFYTLGLIDRERGRLDEARENFKTCLHIREQCLRDYKGHLFETSMKFDWLFALVAVGDHAQAYRAANELHVRNQRDSNNLYRLACIHALSIPAVAEARRPMPLTPEDKKLQETYRAKALDCLEESFAAGWRDFFHTRIDADLAPIRDDPRFKKILAKYVTLTSS